MRPQIHHFPCARFSLGVLDFSAGRTGWIEFSLSFWVGLCCGVQNNFVCDLQSVCFATVQFIWVQFLFRNRNKLKLQTKKWFLAQFGDVHSDGFFTKNRYILASQEKWLQLVTQELMWGSQPVVFVYLQEHITVSEAQIAGNRVQSPVWSELSQHWVASVNFLSVCRYMHLQTTDGLNKRNVLWNTVFPANRE